MPALALMALPRAGVARGLKSPGDAGAKPNFETGDGMSHLPGFGWPRGEYVT
jgi:hypothetical protein